MTTFLNISWQNAGNGPVCHGEDVFLFWYWKKEMLRKHKLRLKQVLVTIISFFTMFFNAFVALWHRWHGRHNVRRMLSHNNCWLLCVRKKNLKKKQKISVTYLDKISHWNDELSTCNSHASHMVVWWEEIIIFFVTPYEVANHTIRSLAIIRSTTEKHLLVDWQRRMLYNNIESFF